MSQTLAQLIQGLSVSASAPTGSLVVTSGGLVGIGTTSPGATLHCVGTSLFIAQQSALFNSSTGTYTTWQNNGTSIGDIGTCNQVTSGGSAGDFGITSRAGSLVLGNNSTEKARIDTSGRLLFGTSTAAGSAILQVAGDLAFNSGYGSVATAYGCRAWVNFNGTTANPSTIRGSGNVSSVTKNGTGDYTVNFTTAMVDVNYSVTGTSSLADSGGDNNGGTMYPSRKSGTPLATGSARISTSVVSNAGVAQDMPIISVAIFR